MPDFIEFRHRVGRVDINIAEGGRRDRPPMLFLHGIASWWQTFEPLFEILRHDWHIFATDLRGSGQSGRAARSYTMLNFVADNLAVLREVVAEPAIVFGHSFGGLMALAMAAERPDLVRAIVVEDAPLFLGLRPIATSTWPRFFGRVEQLVNDHDTVESLADALGRRMPDADRAFLIARATHLRRLDTEAIHMHVDSTNMRDFDLMSLLPRVECPALVIAADGSLGAACTDPADVRHVAGNLRHAQLVQLDGVGHMVHEQRPAEIARLTTDFLNLHLPPAPSSNERTPS